MTFKLKLIKKGRRCYIKIPEQFINDEQMDKYDELEGKLTPSGNLQLMKPLGEGDLCQVCNKKQHKNNKCINCGKLTCAGCFWELGSLCYNCMSSEKKKIK